MASATVTPKREYAWRGPETRSRGKMRRIAIGAALIGVVVLIVRALVPKLHARLMAGCERMFEQMPDDLPPKRMMRGIEEIRANAAGTLALPEERKHAGEAESVEEALSIRTDDMEIAHA
jgi:hypothetical protein